MLFGKFSFHRIAGVKVCLTCGAWDRTKAALRLTVARIERRQISGYGEPNVTGQVEHSVRLIVRLGGGDFRADFLPPRKPHGLSWPILFGPNAYQELTNEDRGIRTEQRAVDLDGSRGTTDDRIGKRLCV